MSGIHQVLAAASPADAITNAAFELRALLRRTGESEIYARHIEPSLTGDVLHLQDYPEQATRDLFVYHASIGEPNVHAFLLSRREPLILVYHNVTPASYFVTWDPTFAELLDLGRSELFELQHRVVLAVADSTFNAVELEAIGYRDVRVIPPIIDPFRLRRTEPSQPTLNHLQKVIAAPVLLFVGQLLPHKRPDFLITAMHIARSYVGIDAHLMLVGHQRLLPYADALRARVRELNLPNVHLVGKVSDAELAALMQYSMGFVTASEHEGFCVPVVEAMAFGLPVLARSCGALAETLGAAGWLIPPTDSEALYAEAMAELAANPALRADLAARGHERLTAFDEERSTAALVSALLEVA